MENTHFLLYNSNNRNDVGTSKTGGTVQNGIMEKKYGDILMQ